MACGLPVVTTEVGGNREVVCRKELGRVVPFGDEKALAWALGNALQQEWKREDIVAYAKDNAWEKRVERLVQQFQRITGVQ